MIILTMINYVKLLFLDIDGVLNSEQYTNWCYTEEGKEYLKNGGDLFVDKNAVKLIEELCIDYGVKLVISSSWRVLTLEATKQEFNNYKDLKCLSKYIVGITPKYYDNDSIRGNEINDFLTHVENTNIRTYDMLYDREYFDFDENDNFSIGYCIVDDDDDMMEYQKDNFVKIDNYTGITEKDIEKIKQILVLID